MYQAGGTPFRPVASDTASNKKLAFIVASCPRFSICSLLLCSLNPTTWVCRLAPTFHSRFKDRHDFEQYPSPLDTIAAQALGIADAPAAPAAAVAAARSRAAEAAVPSRPDVRIARPVRGHRFRADGRRLQIPTPVQQRAIPAAHRRPRSAGVSPTGSGKTAAFMLPAIERFSQLQKTQAAASRASRVRPTARPRAPSAAGRRVRACWCYADARTRDAGHDRRRQVRQAPAPPAHRQHSRRRRLSASS